MMKTVIQLVALGITIYFFGLVSPVVGSSTQGGPAPQKTAPAHDTQRFDPTPPGAEGEQLREDAQKYEKVPPARKSGGKPEKGQSRNSENGKQNNP